jgi:hypothetical protein
VGADLKSLSELAIPISIHHESVGPNDERPILGDQGPTGGNFAGSAKAELGAVIETRNAQHVDESIRALDAAGFKSRLLGQTELEGRTV